MLVDDINLMCMQMALQESHDHTIVLLAFPSFQKHHLDKSSFLTGM